MKDVAHLCFPRETYLPSAKPWRLCLVPKSGSFVFTLLCVLARSAQQVEADREQAEVAESQPLNVNIVLKPKMVHARKKARKRMGEFSSHRVNIQKTHRNSQSFFF